MTERVLKPATEEELAEIQETMSEDYIPGVAVLQSLLDLIAFQRLQIGDMYEESGAYAAGVEDGVKADRARLLAAVKDMQYVFSTLPDAHATETLDQIIIMLTPVGPLQHSG